MVSELEGSELVVSLKLVAEQRLWSLSLKEVSLL